MTTIGTAVLAIIPSLDGVSASVQKQLGGLKGQGKAAGRQLGDGLASGVEAAQARAKKAFDNYGKLADRAADATGKLKTAEAGLQELRDKGITSGLRFTRATEAAEKARRDEARAIKTSTGALKDYETVAKRAERAGKDAGDGFTSGLSSMGSGVMRAGEDAAGSFGDGFAGALSAVRLAGPIGAAITGLGVLGGGILAKELTAEFDKQIGTNLIQASLGISEAEIAKLGSAAGEAWANNYGASQLDNLSTAKAALQNGLLTGVDDPATAKVIGQLTTVSTLLGEDIPTTAAAAGKMVGSGFANDVTEAFDLITTAEQKGLGVNGDLLDSLGEYSVQFTKIGLDGEDTLGLITQMMKGGARNTDLAADALKEFTLRAVDLDSKDTRDAFESIGMNAQDMATKFAEGGPAARDAFGKVVTAIQSIQDPVQKAKTAVALFGTQYEDLGPAFDRMNLGTAAEQEFGKVAGASQRAADVMAANSQNEWESAKRNIIGKIDEIKTALDFGDWANSIPRAFNEWLGPDVELTPGVPGVPVKPATTPGPAIMPPTSSQRPGTNPLDVLIPRNSKGGEIRGPGTGVSDSILAWLSNGEGVVTANGMLNGGAEIVAALNTGWKPPGFAEGLTSATTSSADLAKQFAVSMDPAKYAMGGFSPSAVDCSGFVSAVANVATGRDPFSSRMSTVTEGNWLKSLGFKSGRGGSGDLRIGWWDKGGGKNGHTAGTFPDGTNFESNGSEGVVIGGKTGADSGQFSQHAYLAMAGSAKSSLEQGRESADTALAGEPQVPGSGSSSAPAGGGGTSLPSSFSGLSSFGLSSLGSGIGTTSMGSDLGDFGEAAGVAVSGQVASALDVLGVGDSPGWLQGISTFMGGLSVGGNDPSGKSDGSLFSGANLFGGGQGAGASAAPLSATPTSTRVAPPTDTVHDGRGQAPGPVFNTTIQARDAEGALQQWQRWQNQRAASKLDRY